MSITQRVRAFLNSPNGRRAIEQGRRQLAKPENQRKLRGLVDRLRTRR